jgi:hypothetical protein
MTLPANVNDRNFQRYKDSVSVPGQPGVVVLNPDGTSLAAGGGTSMLDDAAFTPGGSSVTPAGFLGDDTAPDPIDEGDIGAARMRRTTRAQYVEPVDQSGDSMGDDANNALRVNIVAGAGSGGTAQADESAFTEGTTQFTPVGGVLNDTIASDPTEDQAAAVRITPKRAIHVNLRDQTGAEVSVGGGTQYDEDSVHVTGDKVTMAGVVQQTADAALAANGDRAVMQVDETGFLKVNVKAGGAGGTQYDEDTPSAAAEKLTMAGVVRKDTAATLVDLDGDRTELQVDATGLLRARVDAALPAGGNNIGDVDVLTLPADPLGANADAIVAAGAAGSISAKLRRVTQGLEDLKTLIVLAAGSALIGKVQLRNPGNTVDLGDATNPVRTDPTGTTTQPVSDAGGSLTVDAVDLDIRNLATGQDKVDVRVRNAADAAFIEPATDRATAAAPGSARLSDGAAFYDATKTGQLPTALVGGRLDVVVGAALPTGGNNIGDVDVLTLPALPAGDNNIGNVDVLTMPTGASAAQVQGTVAHDAAAAQNPVLQGAYAETPDDSAPGNQVSAEADAVRLAADRDGALYTHPHPPRIWHVSAEHTAQQTDTTVKAAPGAGLSLYITGIYLAVNAAVNVTLEEGTTVLKWKYYAAAQGDGASVNFTVPIKLTANTALTVTTSGAITLTLVVTGYTAP